MRIGVRVLGLMAALLTTAIPGRAEIIGPDAFRNPTLVDFNDLPAGSRVGAAYSGLGVTFTHLCGGDPYDMGMGAGFSPSGSNFGCDPSNEYRDVTARFSTAQTRVGFDIITNVEDDLYVYAWLGGDLVGSQFFATSIAPGSFAGIEFAAGFDRIMLDVNGPSNGAFAIDDFRFESATPVPEPGTMSLLAVALATGVAHRIRRRRAGRESSHQSGSH